MKKLLRGCLLGFVVFVLSMNSIYAKTYQVSETDMSITIDDSIWYVFTRDNIENNTELEELEISYDFMNRFFNDNDAYLDALLFYDDGNYIEMFVRKKPMDEDVINLSNYSNQEVLTFSKEIAKQLEIENYSVYETDYKYANINYYDEDLEMYLNEYITIVNQENYTITFQASAEYLEEEYAEMNAIVDSIIYDIDETLKEENDSFADRFASGALKGAVAGAIAGGVIGAVKMKKKKNNQNSEQETE